MKIPIVKRSTLECIQADLAVWKRKAEMAEEYTALLETLIRDCLGVKLHDHLPNARVHRANQLRAQ